MHCNCWAGQKCICICTSASNKNHLPATYFTPHSPTVTGTSGFWEVCRSHLSRFSTLIPSCTIAQSLARHQAAAVLLVVFSSHFLMYIVQKPQTTLPYGSLTQPYHIAVQHGMLTSNISVPQVLLSPEQVQHLEPSLYCHCVCCLVNLQDLVEAFRHDCNIARGCTAGVWCCRDEVTGVGAGKRSCAVEDTAGAAGNIQEHMQQ